ncbi:MAG: SIS domain-containing protein [Anaerolineae bacterium]|nr:SIS domain-containing protein [Anaerolineae bacterium]
MAFRNDKDELMPQSSTYEELIGQPDAIKRTLEGQAGVIAGLADKLARMEVSRIHLVGCGDSYYGSYGTAQAFKELVGVPVHVDQALEYADYGLADGKGSVVIGLSASGASKTTIRAMKQAFARGAYTIGVTNTPNNLFTDEVDGSIMTSAVRRGWPTQASTTAMSALLLLAAEWGDRRKSAPAGAVDEVRSVLGRYPQLVQESIERFEAPMKKLASEIYTVLTPLYVGSGPSFGTAHFGMAKIKETTQDHSFVLETEEYHHIQSFSMKPGEPVFLVAPQGKSYGRVLETAQSIKRQGGRLIAIVTAGDKEVGPLADVLVEIPAMAEYLTPSVALPALQWFAWYYGEERITHGYVRPAEAIY